MTDDHKQKKILEAGPGEKLVQMMRAYFKGQAPIAPEKHPIDKLLGGKQVEIEEIKDTLHAEAEDLERRLAEGKKKDDQVNYAAITIFTVASIGTAVFMEYDSKNQETSLTDSRLNGMVNGDQVKITKADEITLSRAFYKTDPGSTYTYKIGDGQVTFSASDKAPAEEYTAPEKLQAIKEEACEIGGRAKASHLPDFHFKQNIKRFETARELYDANCSP